jgi:hypothetical protein
MPEPEMQYPLEINSSKQSLLTEMASSEFSGTLSAPHNSSPLLLGLQAAEEKSSVGIIKASSPKDP